MKQDERSLLNAWAKALAQCSTLAWAGARNSSRGLQLHRDGSIGRVNVADDHFASLVRDRDVAEKVELRHYNQDFASECSCGGVRCAHAVALLVELQRRARSAQDTLRTQDAVMGALRQRLQTRNDAAEVGARSLRDLQRLPVDAAVDMVALTWRQSMRPGTQEAEELRLVVERIVESAVAQPAQAREWVVRLVVALAVRKVVFTPLPLVAETALHHALQLLDLTSISPEDPGLAGLTMAVLDGPPQVSPAVAGALVRQAGKNPLLVDALADRLQTWRHSQSESLWRETAQPTGRDLLWSQIIGMLLARGDLQSAQDLAMLWGPGLSELTALQTRLGQAGRVADVMLLANTYDPRGHLWQAGVQAAIDGAWQALQAPNLDAQRRRELRNCLQRLAMWAFEHHPGQASATWVARAAQPAEWPKRRQSLVEHALAVDDAEWLAAWLGGQDDAAIALMTAVQAGPLRDRTVRACLQQLDAIAPLESLRGRELRLVALCSQAAVTPRQLRDELRMLHATAAHIGEPGLAEEFAKLLGREYAEVGAVAQAVTRM